MLCFVASFRGYCIQSAFSLWEFKALPPKSLPLPTSKLVERILVRLERAVVCEPNPHFQTDYSIAWITVLNAARGVREPHVMAYYAVLGVHPDQLFSRIQARRNADLGKEYGKFYTPTGELLPFDSAGLDGVSSLRKPVQAERRTVKRDEESAA